MRTSRLLLPLFIVLLLIGGVPPLVLKAQTAPAAAAKPTALEQQKVAGEEIGLIDAVVSARELYLKNMQKLVDFYARNRNNIKLRMAKEELESLKGMTQQNYVIIAEALGPNLRPQKNIPDAEKLYQEARLLDNNPDPAKADENKRKALDLYLELMSRFPESIRIADAAFYSAVIYEHTLKDYYRAVIYYQRTYEWDALTSHPAQISAARICHLKLNENRMAKQFYEAARDGATSPSDRVEGKGMAELLKAWGF